MLSKHLSSYSTVFKPTQNKDLHSGQETKCDLYAAAQQRDITVVQLKINFSEDQYRNVLRSIYMPYDSKDPPQEEVRKLVTYAKEKGLELLLD